jgi:hypothetical protein
VNAGRSDTQVPLPPAKSRDALKLSIFPLWTHWNHWSYGLRPTPSSLDPLVKTAALARASKVGNQPVFEILELDQFISIWSTKADIQLKPLNVISKASDRSLHETLWWKALLFWHSMSLPSIAKAVCCHGRWMLYVATHRLHRPLEYLVIVCAALGILGPPWKILKAHDWGRRKRIPWILWLTLLHWPESQFNAVRTANAVISPDFLVLDWVTL